MADQLALEMIASLRAFRLPPMIALDVTNVCNLHCIHCPYPSIEARSDFAAAHFPWAYFEKLIAELGEHDQPCLLRLVGDGEPMLHPRIIDMVNLAKGRTQCAVNLTTNGTYLSDENIDRLLEAKLDLIDVSLDGVTKPVYEAIRKKSSYERVMRNMFALLERRKRHKSATKVMVSFVRQSENEAEVGLFERFWQPLVDHVMIRELHSALGRVKPQESAARSQVYQIERYPCPHLWKRLVIDSRGTVKFCATDWGEATKIGNIGESSLKSLWEGEPLSRLRTEHLESRIASGSACEKCNDWAASKWDWGYERLVDKVVYERPTLAPRLPLLR
jgi:radical SAM protein with 4Fe4S-binding SPASM domain